MNNNFQWAWFQLLAGKKVRRKNFGDGYRIFLDHDRKQLTTERSSGHFGTTLSYEDVMATDWELWEEPEPEPKELFRAVIYQEDHASPWYKTLHCTSYEGAVAIGKKELRTMSHAHHFTIEKVYQF